MRFSDIPGYTKEKEQLIKMVKQGKLAHALLFSGENGSWNLPLALAMAAFVNCEQPTDSDSCGKCQACSQNDKYVHPDVNFSIPLTTKVGVKPEDIISQNFLKEWRSFLTKNPYADKEVWSIVLDSENKLFNISKEESKQIIKNLSLKSFSGGYKVSIIWLAELMHHTAANGILKILEEPADKTLFILVSNDSAKLLSTILSRVRTIAIRKPNQTEIADWLMKFEECPTEEAHRLSRMAEGDVNLALRLQADDQSKLNGLFREWLLACYAQNYIQLISFSDDFSKMSKVAQQAFMQYGQNVLREVFLQITNIDRTESLTPDFLQFVSKLASLFTEEKVSYFSKTMDKSAYLLERNANVKVTFLDLSLKLSAVFRK